MVASELTVIAPLVAFRTKSALNSTASVPPTEYVRVSLSGSVAVTVPTASSVVASSATLKVTRASAKTGDGLASVAPVESTDTLCSDSDESV